jgi:hypothetical protein
MTKRFLNIIYSDRRTEIDVTGFERLSEVQDKIKEKFGDDIPAPAARIQVSDQQGTVIGKWASINSLHDDYFTECGTCLVVGTLPAPTSEIQNPQKRLRSDVEIPDLTSQFKSFYNSEISGDNFIVSVPGEILPYPQDEIQRLYVRKCYQDIFDLLLERISSGMKSFAISGTPGTWYRKVSVFCLHSISTGEGPCPKIVKLRAKACCLSNGLWLQML